MANITDTMMQKMLSDLMKTPRQRELENINLELARLRLDQAGSSTNIIQNKLDYLVSTEDTTTASGLENAIAKIDNAISTNVFGEKNKEFVQTYRDGIVVGKDKTQEINNIRKTLYDMSLSNNINANLNEAYSLTDDGNNVEAIEYIENRVYDLISNKDRLNDLGKLDPTYQKRVDSVLVKYDNMLKELGGDGLTKKELASIKNSTYSFVKENELTLNAQLQNTEKIAQFNNPTLKDKELSGQLHSIQNSLLDFSDKMEEVKYEQMLISNQNMVEGTGSAELQKKNNDILHAELARDLLVERYAPQYKKIYDIYMKNRKDNPNRTFPTNFTELMNPSIHNELYNYKSESNNNNNNNNYKKLPHQQGNRLVEQMLQSGKRNIVFNKDIIDSSGKIWAKEGQKINSIGNQKIKINRDKSGNLKNKTFKFNPMPRFSGYMPLYKGVTPGAEEEYAPRTITLNTDDFFIEGSQETKDTPGYQMKNGELLEYDILNNIFKPITR